MSGLRTAPLAAILALSLLSAATGQPSVTGRVVAVHDGDTITVRTSDTTIRVRLADIDCPELGQPYSSRARDFTSRLLLDHAVRVETRGLDQYNRIIGRVFVGGTDASAALVSAGLAWVYTRGIGDRALNDAERDARARGAGLWADASPEPPWIWRRAHGESAAAPPPRHDARGETAERLDLRDARGPFHGNTQSRVFHRPGCPHYNCKHCEETFLTVESAMEAGYRPAGDCLRN